MTNQWFKSISVYAALVLSLAACNDGAFGERQVYLPACDLDTAEDITLKVPHDTHPTRRMNFYIQLVDSSGSPLANRRVVYTYQVPGMVIGGFPVTAFTQELRTDTDGYATVTSENEAALEVQGSYWSDTESSMTSWGVGALIGPIGGGGGSSSSSTSTTGGFYVRVDETRLPIALVSQTYEGSLRVLGDSLQDAAPILRETQESIIGPGVRWATEKGESTGYGYSNRWGYKYAFNGTTAVTPSCESIFEWLALYRELPVFRDTAAPQTSQPGMEITCEEFDAIIANTTCQHDFVRNVFEVYQLAD